MKNTHLSQGQPARAMIERVSPEVDGGRFPSSASSARK